jgi:hypothetical protein
VDCLPKRGDVVETKFRVFDLLEIAEAVERRRARFYVQKAPLFEDAGSRELCFKLANWSVRHAEFWAQKRKKHSSETGECEAFDPNDYVRSNPAVMAGLTWCAKPRGSAGKLTGTESQRQILSDALQRSKELLTFYDGLKEFAHDPATWAVIDTIISRETNYIGTIDRLITHTRHHNPLNCEQPDRSSNIENG